jgi:hypothetical protein
MISTEKRRCLNIDWTPRSETPDYNMPLMQQNRFEEDLFWKRALPC